ncbi:MAG TPA: carboxypeptidase regulatory-like domain-containing protein [Casimicrobiaceae bacterium]|nr:carboxypeptidase regulatory-like domain-containing protein [Casimicrobiaceae bacterium]
MFSTNRWCSAAVLAATLAVAAPGVAAAADDVPPVHNSGSVSYVSGGISSEQQAAMERDWGGYPLELRFLAGGQASWEPSYVPVTIKDHAGNVVLDASSYGPLMLAKLPDGEYTVSARYAGRTETLEADVENGKHTMLAFDWQD